ncbi:MAG: hypothetical protein AAGB05_06105 [Pseudomonadota bacterium]
MSDLGADRAGSLGRGQLATPGLVHSSAAMLLVVALVATAVRFTIVGLGLETLDRQAYPDDTYYVLTIARNMALGIGPSVDGTTLTTGFQPLIALFLTPVFWLTDDPHTAAYAAGALSAVFGVTAVALAARLTLALTGSALAGLGVGLVAATGPVFVLTHLNGLETSLAATAFLATVTLTAETARGASRKRYMAIGALAGLAILARIDSVVLLVPLAAWGVIAHGWRAIGSVTGAMALVVAPWVAVCLVVSGTLIPESGGAVQTLAAAYEIAPWTMVAGGALVLSGLVPGQLLALGKGGGTETFIAAYMVWAILLATLVRSAWRRQYSLATALSLSAILLFLAYTTKLGAFWFFERYFAPIFVLALILGAVLFCEMSRNGRGLALGRWRVGAGSIGGLLAVFFSGTGLVFTTAYAISPHSIERAYSPPMAYSAAAHSFFPDLPAGARLGAFQSGALAYFAPDGLEVVNLDGVVNGAAAEAFRTRTMCAYLATEGITHFLDWEGNHGFLMDARGEGSEIRLTLMRRDVVVPGQNPLFLWEVALDCA